jgi:hypothetical protein
MTQDIHLAAGSIAGTCKQQVSNLRPDRAPASTISTALVPACHHSVMPRYHNLKIIEVFSNQVVQATIEAP